MKMLKASSALRSAVTASMLLGTAVIATVSGMIVSQMQPKSQEAPPDYLIVLGARVKGTMPGKALSARIKTAKTYLLQNPKTIAVLSGGIHSGATVSEAACMYRMLIEAGITKDRLILEPNSLTTEENLIRSFALIPQGKSVGILTSDYHLFRAKLLSRKMGFPVSGVPAISESSPTFIRSFVREHVAVIHAFLRGKI